jgi:tetratricopeptide (TPR) repeat protein
MVRQPDWTAPATLTRAWFVIDLSRTCPRSLARTLLAALLILFAPGFATAPPSAQAGVSSDSPRRNGAPGMLEPRTGSLLVDYYETYLRDHDIEAFRLHVSARYMEGTLARLIDSPNPQDRRAAVLALGLFGSFSANAAVAKALRDSDPTVRSLADNALWAIWFRADSPENNATLERVGRLISQQRFEDAVSLASKLIERAPRFAEAYNQRAIAEYYLGRFKESADDCRLVLERNPYHVGALAGLAKCQIRSGQREPAIETLRRSSKLQPFNEDLKQWISALETGAP